MIRYSVELIGDTRAFLKEWRALHAHAGEQPFFLSPDWMSAWLADPPSDCALYAVKASCEAKPILLGVFGRRARRRPPIIGLHTVHLHEFGNSERDAIYIEYNDFLVDSDAPLQVRRDALCAILEAFPKDDFVFRNARPALTQSVEQAAIAASRLVRVVNRQPTFEIDLRNAVMSREDYFVGLSGSFGNQLRRALRGYEARGALTFEIAADNERKGAVWRNLLSLHEEAWRQRGHSGAFSNPAFLRFHERLLDQSPEKIDLAQLSCNGEAIACLYNFIFEDRVMNYQSGFRMETDNHLKPGLLAHAFAINHYAQSGFSAYDFLAGDALYKRRFAAQRETLSTVVLERREGLAFHARRAARALRRGLISVAKKRQT